MIIETDDPHDMMILANAVSYYCALFDLKANFHRRFESIEDKPEAFYEGMYHVLDELKKEIEDIKIE